MENVLINENGETKKKPTPIQWKYNKIRELINKGYGSREISNKINVHINIVKEIFSAMNSGESEKKTFYKRELIYKTVDNDKKKEKRKTYDILNKEEITEQRKEYREKNKVRLNTASREYYNSNKNNFREYWLIKSYGIDLQEYDRLYKLQKGRCCICKKHQNKLLKPLHLDHNHETKKVRGLLCPNCNHALGNFKDNIILIENAIQYLKRKVEFSLVYHRIKKLSDDKYGYLLNLQNGGCAICGKFTNGNRKKFFEDHDHLTGLIRGLLCSNCNSGLGELKDNVILLRRAIEYLKNDGVIYA